MTTITPSVAKKHQSNQDVTKWPKCFSYFFPSSSDWLVQNYESFLALETSHSRLDL